MEAIEDPFRFKKILVPLDGSECAEMALEPALAIAQAMAAELVLFRVAQPIPRTRALMEMPDVYNEVVAAAYREAEDYLRDLKARLPYVAQSVSTEHEPVVEGVARQILSYATANGIDLIVISSHGYSGVRRWTHGSVAEKVLRGACCATLIIRCLSESLLTSDSSQSEYAAVD
jgi:nucleotide-binding universal stress UspA family protein